MFIIDLLFKLLGYLFTPTKSNSKSSVKLPLNIIYGIFVGSLAFIAVVYWAGYKINGYENNITNMNDNTKKNTILIEKVNQKIIGLEKGRSADFNMIYQDMVDINKRNNYYWNNKFDILLKYGSINKELAKDLMDSEEAKQKIEDENFLKSKEYLNKNSNTDTIK